MQKIGHVESGALQRFEFGIFAFHVGQEGLT